MALGITQGQLAALNTMITKVAEQGFKDDTTENNWGEMFVEKKQTDRTENNRIAWIRDFAKLSEINSPYDNAVRKDLISDYLEFQMRYFADGLRISSVDANLDVEKMGWMQKAKQIGIGARMHVTELVIEVISTATAIAAYDGDMWFGNTHPRGGTTYDNLLAGDFSATTLAAGVIAMGRFPDDLGDPMNLKPNFLLLPDNPDYMVLAPVLLRSNTVPGSTVGNVNPYEGLVQNYKFESRSISSGDSDKDDWYLFKTDGFQKPMYHVGLRGYDTPTITNNMMEIQSSKWNKIYEWKLEIYHTVVPTFPFLGIKYVGA